MASRLSDRIQRWREVWRKVSGRGQYPHELAFLLLFPGRSFVLSPKELTRRLALRPGMRVLEVGPGPGFFSIEVARSVRPARLVLLDAQIEMLQKARRRLSRARAENADFVWGVATGLPLAPNSFDVIFYVTVLGEVPDPAAALREARRLLRPGGIVSITELAGDPDALSREEIRDLAEKSGLIQSAEFSSRGGFTINLTPHDHADPIPPDL